MTCTLLGRFVRDHYRAKLATSSIQAVARSMHKHGLPLWAAVAILATR